MGSFTEDGRAAIDSVLAECGVPPSPPLLTLQFGTATMQSMVDPGKALTACNVSASLMTQFGPFLAAIRPLLCAINVISKLYDIFADLSIDNIPDIPDKLDAIQEDIACILKVIPQLSIPLMAVDALLLVLTQLVCIRNQLRVLEQASRDAAALLELAEEHPDQAARILALAACKQNNIDAVSASLVAAVGGIKVLMVTVQVLGDLVGLEIFSEETVDSLDDFGAGALDTLADLLNDIIYPMISAVEVLKDASEALGAPVAVLPNLAWACDSKDPERECPVEV